MIVLATLLALAEPPTPVEPEPAVDAAAVEPVAPEAPAPLPAGPTDDRPELGAVGSDAAPLPPAPPRSKRAPTGGPWFGRGWLELGADLIYIGHLPRNLRILSAGLSGGGGWRPHRFFGLGTQVSTWISDAETQRGFDDAGNRVVVRASVPITVWDTLVLKMFVPLRRRIEPVFEVATGLAVERSPFRGRRPWGTVRAGAGFDVYLAPTMTLGFGGDYRLLARRDAFRHSVGGRVRLGFHF